MTILEMATLLGTQLKLTRGEGCWGAGFSDLVETKDGCILGSLHGLGETAYDAVIDLVGGDAGKNSSYPCHGAQLSQDIDCPKRFVCR